MFECIFYDTKQKSQNIENQLILTSSNKKSSLITSSFSSYIGGLTSVVSIIVQCDTFDGQGRICWIGTHCVLIIVCSLINCWSSITINGWFNPIPRCSSRWSTYCTIDNVGCVSNYGRSRVWWSSKSEILWKA
jgi:hypothetical protein